MSPVVQAFAAGFPVALEHAGASLAFLIVGAVLYALLTPYKEIQAIREGNAAAAVSYGGVLVGLAGPLAISMMTATSLEELALWGGGVTLISLISFRIVDLLLTGLPQRAQEGEVSAAVLLVAAKLAVAMLIAAALPG